MASFLLFFSIQLTHGTRNIHTMPMITYRVSGLTCGGCVNRVKTTLAAYAEAVEVTLTPPEATLHQPTADIAALNAALALVGSYELTPTEAASTSTVEVSHTLPPEENKSWFTTYKPLLLVFAFILLVTLVVEASHGDFDLTRWMPHFMAGFFLVFSFFKLLDLHGFASSYAMYDLLAKRVLAYASGLH